ncbi:heparin lyase I family protein [Aquincola tertiaricarbonis]|uniref:heparin lyase I family protein n=1 Tax=Aquincola tertiaricarbonis TaxID=391953 RepID=UPI0009F924B3|nr:heparin lyase I family protein [Aquincola tertiaricarbonis]
MRNRTVQLVSCILLSNLGVSVAHASPKDDEALTAQRHGLQAAEPQRLKTERDPAGGGRQVFHMRLDAADRKVANGQRTEVFTRDAATAEGVRWFALSVYVPAPWTPARLPISLAQVHTSRMGVPVPPPIGFVVRGDDLALLLREDQRQAPDQPLTQDQLNTRRVALGKLPLDRWVCWVLRSQWSKNADDRRLTVWDGRQQVYDSGPAANSYLTRPGNYPKVGLYAPGGVAAASREMYADAIRVGRDESNFDDMFAKTPCGELAKR